MSTWFTVDQHFGHARLLELPTARDAAFPAVAEMNALLVRNWNAVVQPDDTVWVPGDSDMHGARTPPLNSPALLRRGARLAPD